MKLDSLIKSATDLAKNVVEKNELAQKQARELSKYTNTQLNITNGFQQINAPAYASMWQLPSGEVFFNADDRELYWFIEYIWDGPQYKTVSKSSSNSVHTQKGKGMKIGGGATIGALVAGPTGALIGGAMGAGSKGQKTISESGYAVTEQCEVYTPATLKFKKVSTGEAASIVIACTTDIDSQLKRFSLYEENDDTDTETDPVNEIRRYKELFDEGIITEDEFLAKKKQLLNL